MMLKSNMSQDIEDQVTRHTFLFVSNAIDDELRAEND